MAEETQLPPESSIESTLANRRRLRARLDDIVNSNRNADATMRSMIDDARDLLAFVISGEIKDRPEQLPKEVIDDIAAVTFAAEDDNGVPAWKSEQWDKFLAAYAKLTAFTSPVTAKTLRDTDPAGPNPAAQEVTRWLWWATAVFVVTAICGNLLDLRVGPALEGEAEGWEFIRQILSVLEPFTYGGLGACAYLLRRAHAFIAQRSFDISYKSEYRNRIVLGLVSGGGLVLLAGQFTDGDGTIVKIGEAALGFLGGYSTDFLFTTVERLLAALLPKIGLDSIRKDEERRDRATADMKVDLTTKLADLAGKATDPAVKAAIVDIMKSIRA